MPAYYSVIRYVPDPASEERINIGVLAFGDGRVRSRFLRHWQRVRSFAGPDRDITFLRDFAEEISQQTDGQLALPGVTVSQPLTEEEVRRIASRWINSIQISAPVGALMEPDELLEDVAEQFLLEPKPRSRPARGRDVAAGLAVQSIRQALGRRLNERAVKHLIKPHLKVSGRLDDHDFDFGLQNGRVYTAGRGVSFEIADDDLETQLQLTLFSIDDVRRVNESLPLAVVVLPPSERTARYERFAYSVQQAGAELVEEYNIDAWAERTVQALSPELPLDG